MSTTNTRPATEHELAILDALYRVRSPGWVTSQWLSQYTGQTWQGAATVCNSALRKGLTRRDVVKGHVYWRLTAKGRRVIREHLDRVAAR
jgi:hypothetical protein